MNSLSRRQIMIGVLIVIGVCVFSVWVDSRLDTNHRRMQVNEKIGKLRDRVKKNPNDKEALKRMIASLGSSYHWERTCAANRLGQLGPKAKEAVPALANALKIDDWYLRREAALALREIGPGAME